MHVGDATNDYVLVPDQTHGHWLITSKKMTAVEEGTGQMGVDAHCHGMRCR